MRLSDFDIGKDNADAERDVLQHYFIKTPAFYIALNKPRLLVLGRRGTGKSAIRLGLENELSQSKNGVLITMRPDERAWLQFKDYFSKLTSPDRSLLWEFILYSEIFLETRFSRAISNSPKLRPLQEAFQLYYNQPRFVHPSSDRDILESLLELAYALIRSTKVVFKVPGVEAEIDLSGIFEKNDSKRNPQTAVTQIRKLLKQYLPENANVRVLIDHLDDWWKGTPKEVDVITSLLIAVDQIHGLFPAKQISVTVFLRTDI